MDECQLHRPRWRRTFTGFPRGSNSRRHRPVLSGARLHVQLVASLRARGGAPPAPGPAASETPEPPPPPGPCRPGSCPGARLPLQGLISIEMK